MHGRSDAGHDRSRTDQMPIRTDSGPDGCRQDRSSEGRMQNRSDAGQDRSRTDQMPNRTDSGSDGCRTVPMQGRQGGSTE